MKQFLEAFYGCHYDQFFINLAQLESERLKFDRYMAPHYSFYSRALRLNAYEQFLTPYKTVSFMHPFLPKLLDSATIIKMFHLFQLSHCRCDWT